LKVAVNRFEVYLVNVDSKTAQTRPCVVVSPNEMNHNIRTVIVAPMTASGKSYPTRIACRFKGKRTLVLLDQILTIPKSRLTKKLGRLHHRTTGEVLAVLREMFEA
jgi:mRNA interferase MazF